MVGQVHPIGFEAPSLRYDTIVVLVRGKFFREVCHGGKIGKKNIENDASKMG